MDHHLWFYYLAGVPLLGVAAQWLAWRLRLPSILLLLAFGVGLGIAVDQAITVPNDQSVHGLDELLSRLAGPASEPAFGPRLLFPLVSLAVAVILFEGGLSLRFAELKEAGGGLLRLVTVGALVSWGLIAACAYLVLGLHWKIAALLGAILIVTGPTVVAPLLRHIRPAKRIGSIIKWEGIVIDPVGAVLAVLVFEVLLEPSHTFSDGMLALGKTVVIGGGLGFLTGWLLTLCLKRFWIPDFLHGVAFLAVALGVFAVSNWLQEESGLVTVTVLGLQLVNQKQVSIRHVIEFKEHLRTFLISCLFIALGSRLDPHSLQELGWRGVAFLVLLIVLVRPVSVWIASWGSSLSRSERWFLAFLAPRGVVAAAVSSVFALKAAAALAETELMESPELQELAAQADRLGPVTFLVIVGTVGIYGLAAAPLARRLGLADPSPQGILFAGAEPWIRELASALQAAGKSVMLVDTNYANVAAAKMEGLAAECYSILSEHVREDLDLGGIGRLIALTPNDEVNTLAVHEFEHLFGRENLYQLTPWDKGSGRRESIAKHLHGRLVFQEGLTHDELAARITRGTVKRTQLSQEFNYEDFRETHGESAVVAFLVHADGGLTVCAADEAPSPEAGDVVIAIVDAAE